MPQKIIKIPKTSNIHNFKSQIPALVLYKGSLEAAAKNGTIIFYHGFASTKEAGDKELNSLMKEGYLVVAVDNVDHGERKATDFDSKYSERVGNFDDEFTKAVFNTADEVSDIIDYVISDLAPKAEKFATCGISMGGYITFRSILCDKRISVAIPILGSPTWKSSDPVIQQFSPHNFASFFSPCKILSLNGGADESVPPHNTREFHKTLDQIYGQTKENQGQRGENKSSVKYIEIENAPHFMSEEDWNYLWSKVLDWFIKHLLKGE